jgi:hypothetical protein
VPAALAASPLGQSLKLEAGKAVLLSRNGATWSLLAIHAWPAALPPEKNWTAELSPGPFCR